MEHEVHVPFPVGSVRAALAERARVTRCVPGLQLAATGSGGGAVEGRLRVRISGSTITYRGSVKIAPQGDGFAVKGTGSEVRGDGSVKLTLKVVPRRAAQGEGTRLTCKGKLTGDGRIAEFEEKATIAAGRRLLDRFGAALAESIRAEPPLEQTENAVAPDAEMNARAAAGIGEPDDNDRAIPGIPGPEKGDSDRGRDGESKDDPQDPPADPSSAGPSSADTTAEDGGAGNEPTIEEGREADGSRQPGPDVPGASGSSDTSGPADGSDSPAASGAEPTTGGVFDAEIPPPSLDPRLGGEEDDEVDGMGEDMDDDPDDVRGMTAEAAHARRTMIGRSAEEVDHAPPRGRYAPVPAPEATAATATLRWAAPAAALVVAGAVVLSRALRRRR